MRSSPHKACAYQFRTLPPLEAALRSARIDTLVREAEGRKALPHASTRCPGCTWSIAPSEHVAITPAGVFHAGCAR